MSLIDGSGDGAPQAGGQPVFGIASMLTYSIAGATGDVEIVSTEPYLVTTSAVSGNRGASGFFMRRAPRQAPQPDPRGCRVNAAFETGGIL